MTTPERYSSVYPVFQILSNSPYGNFVLRVEMKFPSWAPPLTGVVLIGVAIKILLVIQGHTQQHKNNGNTSPSAVQESEARTSGVNTY